MKDPVAFLAGRRACRFQSAAATVFEFEQAALLPDWEACWELLDEGERARANRFVVDGAKRRFVLSHAALRLTLASRIGGDGRDIRYDTIANGKPCLARRPGTASLEFNMSHSGDRVLIALSDDRPVGIDVEVLRPIDRLRGLAETIFSAREMAVFDRLSPDDANGFLLRLWTFKEAIVKATGLGLSVDPRKVGVPDDILQNGPTAELSFQEATWRVHDLGSEGYAAALAHAA